MQFRHIMKSLKDDYTISVCSEQNTDKINDIQLLDPLAESYDPQVLYVADKHAVSTCKSFPLHLVASCNPADFLQKIILHSFRRKIFLLCLILYTHFFISLCRFPAISHN